MLRQVADQIGAPLKPGVCEIFPDECRGIGRAIRAPGTWNPKNGACGLILHETFSKVLTTSISPATPKESNTFLGTRCKTREENRITPSSVVFRGECGEWPGAFSITAARTRHERLLKLVGAIFLQVSQEVARKNAELQHCDANPVPVATLAEHVIEFDEMWVGMERQWRAKLSSAERAKFDELTTDNDREAFRIVRNWSQTDQSDFKVHCKSLANRLGVTLKTASNIRRRFCLFAILRETAPYVPQKLCARFKWIANVRANQRLSSGGRN